MKNHRISPEKLKELEPEIKNWKEQYSNGVILISLVDDPVDVIAKVPSLHHMKEANSLKNEFDANKQLVLSCVLYPENFASVLEEKDTLSSPLATELVNAAGLLQERIVKKL